MNKILKSTQAGKLKIHVTSFMIIFLLCNCFNYLKYDILELKIKSFSWSKICFKTSRQKQTRQLTTESDTAEIHVSFFHTFTSSYTIPACSELRLCQHWLSPAFFLTNYFFFASLFFRFFRVWKAEKGNWRSDIYILWFIRNASEGES